MTAPESRRLRTQAERDADRWQPPEPRCTLPGGTCYCTRRPDCQQTNEDAFDDTTDDELTGVLIDALRDSDPDRYTRRNP